MNVGIFVNLVDSEYISKITITSENYKMHDTVSLQK